MVATMTMGDQQLIRHDPATPVIDLDNSMEDEDDDDDDDDTVVGTCLHCNAPPPPRSSSLGSRSSANPGGGGGGGPCSFATNSVLPPPPAICPPAICPPAAARVQVSCDDCRSFICDGCHWCHEFQANHEIRVCDRCDAFYCRGCDEMDQCEDCSEVVCNTCSTLMSCKFCGCGLCEDCATACGRCGIVLCQRDAKFAVECDTCKMAYCLVCLASGTKDQCIRCGHRPSKRMEQLVHLRLKSIYKAFKQSGATMEPGSGAIGGGPVTDLVSSMSGKIVGHGKDGGATGGKYSSALRALLTDNGPDSTKDNFSNFDQSMASEVAAVLQTASNTMAMVESNADYLDGPLRRPRGTRTSSHDLSPGPGLSRNRSSSRTSNAAAERYFQKTQAEMEVAAAHAEAEAEAAAAALLAELDDEKACPNATSKKSKKKKKKKGKTKENALSDQAVIETSSFTDKYKPEGKDAKISSAQMNKNSKKMTLPQNSSKAHPLIEDDSSDDEMNFEQLVGRTKGSTRPFKKEKTEENSEEKTSSSPTPKPDNPPSQETTATSTAHFDAELAVLLSNDNEVGLEAFLTDLKGVPGLGAARKTARKALKRIKEARELSGPSDPEKHHTQIRISSNELSSNVEVDMKATKLTAKAVASKVTAGPTSAASTGAAAANASAFSPINSFSLGNQHEPLLRVVSRTQSNSGNNAARGVASNSNSVPTSTRAECVMHISPVVVGWVIGKGGSRIRDMMEESGAKIWIDQESMGAKESRVVYVSGKRSSVDSAVRMVKDLVAKAPVAASAAASQGVAAAAAPALASAPTMKSTPVPRSLPASPLLSSTLGSLKEPTSFAAAITSGASAPAGSTPPGPNPVLSTKQQHTSTHGWALPAHGISIPASSLPQAAPQSVRFSPKPAAVENAGGASLFSPIVTSELSCDPRFVALLIGRRGWTVKNIQTESGANLRIDQSVDPPKIIISGSTVDVKKAEQMVRDVLKYPQAQLTPPLSEEVMFNSIGRPEHLRVDDVQTMPQMTLPLLSVSTQKFLEKPRKFSTDGATNFSTMYGQYQQHNRSNISPFQESPAGASMAFILPNDDRRQTQPPSFVNFVDADSNARANRQEWGHQSQVPQYTALPPFPALQAINRDQYNRAIPNPSLTQQSSLQDHQRLFSVPLQQEQLISFPPRDLEAEPRVPNPSLQKTPARMNVVCGNGMSGQSVNGWDSLAPSTSGGTWNQSHFSSIPSAPQHHGFHVPAAPPLSNNPFQQSQNHITPAALASAYNNRISDDSLMVDNMFASMGASDNNGDGLLSALNSVSLSGSALQKETWESKIPGWGGEDASLFLHESRLGDYRDEE